MISEYFTADDISVMYDSNEGLYYLHVEEGCTEDYTKEELVDLLKRVISSLGEWMNWLTYQYRKPKQLPFILSERNSLPLDSVVWLGDHYDYVLHRI